jgi:uncharacterized damage-inducible protein DinB
MSGQGRKRILLEQFSRCYDENGWFVSIRNCVDGLTDQQVDWKPAGADNSIKATLTHLTYYNGAYMLRFKGIDYKYQIADNDESFEADESWPEVLARFDAVMNEFRELIRSADESKFNEQVPQKEERKWWELIADINAHNAYHAGQILLIRKLQGSWNPEKGVS